MPDAPRSECLTQRRVLAMFTDRSRLAVRDTERLESAVGALRQGDDLGFKTATFLSPDDLKRFAVPIWKRLADEAHGNGKPFILHSCGTSLTDYMLAQNCITVLKEGLRC